jgi:acyl-CoA thioesterase I
MGDAIMRAGGSRCLREIETMRIGKLFAAILFASVACVWAQPATTEKAVVFLGDSLTAGYGVQPAESFPALIAEKIRAAGLPFEVVNAGLSGDTSAGGLRRIDWILQRPISVLLLALGANDGLRGLPPSALKTNLETIIEKVRVKNPQTKIIIAGMQMPPNLGADYASRFEKVFGEVAKEKEATLIPFLLAGVGGHRDLNQPDLIHPTAAGHKIVAETVWQTLEPILRNMSPQ